MNRKNGNSLLHSNLKNKYFNESFESLSHNINIVQKFNFKLSSSEQSY